MVLGTTDEPQWQRISQTRWSEARPHKQQTTLLLTTALWGRSTHREPMITKWRKLSSGVGGARGEPRSSKLPQSRGDARRQRTETMSQPEEPVMKKSQRKRQSQIAEMEHRCKELGRRRVEDLRESHSAEQSGRRA